MVLILFFTIAGFLAGLFLVMVKRKIRPQRILTVAFLGLAMAGIWKIIKDYSKSRKKKKYF